MTTLFTDKNNCNIIKVYSSVLMHCIQPGLQNMSKSVPDSVCSLRTGFILCLHTQAVKIAYKLTWIVAKERGKKKQTVVATTLSLQERIQNVWISVVSEWNSVVCVDVIHEMLFGLSENTSVGSTRRLSISLKASPLRRWLSSSCLSSSALISKADESVQILRTKAKQIRFPLFHSLLL